MAALESLAPLPHRRRVVVIGEMLELGDATEAEPHAAAMRRRRGLAVVDHGGVAGAGVPVVARRGPRRVKSSPAAGALRRRAGAVAGEPATRCS